MLGTPLQCPPRFSWQLPIPRLFLILLTLTLPALLTLSVTSLSSNCAVYDGGCVSGEQEILVIGDSVTRFIKPACGLTFCFFGFEVLDVLDYAPALIEKYPTAHTVILHVIMLFS